MVESTWTAKKSDEDSSLYRDASGRVYRIPNADYHRLLAKKSALGTKQRQLDELEDELESVEQELNREQLYLNRYNQVSVDAFNRKVERYNSLNESLQPLVDGYNRDVNAFNAELARVGTLIR